MYMFREMIKMGLKDDQVFPSPQHKHVASSIGICNPNVSQLDTLIDIVQSVLKVPQDRIETVTFNELRDEFGMPEVG